jgi:hypothetical protein
MSTVNEIGADPEEVSRTTVRASDHIDEATSRRGSEFGILFNMKIFAVPNRDPVTGACGGSKVVLRYRDAPVILVCPYRHTRPGAFEVVSLHAGTVVPIEKHVASAVFFIVFAKLFVQEHPESSD